MRLAILALSTILFVLASCNSEVNTAKERTQPFAYFNENIGWKLNVPVGYQIIEGDQLYENNKEGIEQTEHCIARKCFQFSKR